MFHTRRRSPHSSSNSSGADRQQTQTQLLEHRITKLHSITVRQTKINKLICVLLRLSFRNPAVSHTHITEHPKLHPKSAQYQQYKTRNIAPHSAHFPHYRTQSTGPQSAKYPHYRTHNIAHQSEQKSHYRTVSTAPQAAKNTHYRAPNIPPPVRTIHTLEYIQHCNPSQHNTHTIEQRALNAKSS